MWPTPIETAAIVERLEAHRPAEDLIRLRIRTHLEKFDHLVEPPRLIEYQIREHGRCVYLERYDAASGRMRRLMPSEEGG